MHEPIDWTDYELNNFAKHGCPPSPANGTSGYVTHQGAQIWHAVYGSGPPAILLHGGLGHSGNWGHQVAALCNAGYSVVTIDSRGHGRSTRDERPFSYELMAADVLAVMDQLSIRTAAMVGWSDGACTALALANEAPARTTGVFFFACNVNSSGTKPFVETPTIKRCFERHRADYEKLSVTPGAFDNFVEAVSLMQTTQPNYSADDLARIEVPVDVVQSEHDEFIKLEHAKWLAEELPNARFSLLEGVSHFAPLQQPALFNESVLSFLSRTAR